uniref:Putative secreted protein n=1 Tax=Anopheles marajoara TaxID=58244 RepID=A0A2M4CFZ5_9DIPT
MEIIMGQVCSRRVLTSLTVSLPCVCAAAHTSSRGTRDARGRKIMLALIMVRFISTLIMKRSVTGTM